MGGGSYDRSVYSSDGGSSGGGSRSSSSFTYSRTAEKELNTTSLDTSLFPKKRDLTCKAKTGIVIVLDDTGSMGDAAKTIFDKMPMFFGQIEQQGYLDDFAISFAAVGDIYSDSAPLQVCNFAKGLTLDKKLKKIFLEGGGGGSAEESYEMMALYYLRHVEYTHPEATKPFFFFIGDEGFYDKIPAEQVARHLGDDASQNVASRAILDELREKYHAFMLHVPYSSRPDTVNSNSQTKLVVSGNPYADQRIKEQWKKVFGEDFMVVEEPKSIVDVILGCIALASETRSLDEYLDDMRERKQTDDRVDRVEETLKPKSDALARVSTGPVSVSPAAIAETGKKRGGRSKRI